jgi:hypothetical protein
MKKPVDRTKLNLVELSLDDLSLRRKLLLIRKLLLLLLLLLPNVLLLSRLLANGANV